MSSRNLYGHPAVTKGQKLSCWFEGTGLLRKGIGVAYNSDYGTAADADGERRYRVELLTAANHKNFAGVTAQEYPADSKGQGIEIYEPGSVCEIAVGLDTVVNETVMGCLAQTGGNGHFYLAGFGGMKGSALALQTTTIGGDDRSATAALSTDGLTLTHAGQTFVTDGVVAGDIVHIVAGEDDATDAAIPGEYVISSVTSETVLVLATTASDGTTSTLEVSYFVSGTDKFCTAYLYDGEESSGCVELVQPTSGASQTMVGGFSFIHGGQACGADSTAVLADGFSPGERKGICLLVAFTTDNYVVTVTSGHVVGLVDTTYIGQSNNLATLVIDAAGDYAILQWGYDEWSLTDMTPGIVTTE